MKASVPFCFLFYFEVPSCLPLVPHTPPHHVITCVLLSALTLTLLVCLGPCRFIALLFVLLSPVAVFFSLALTSDFWFFFQ